MNSTTKSKETTPRCRSCGNYLPKFDPYEPGYYRTKRPKKKIPGSAIEGQDPQWGARGDNIVCSTRCGHDLLIKLVKSVPGCLDLLPDVWKMDLLPVNSVPKIIEKRKAVRAFARRRQASFKFHLK